MTSREIKGLTDEELNFKIDNLSKAVGVQPTGKFINSSFFWNGLFELVKILIKLFKERKRRTK